jgi:hypothetical protein
VVISPATKCLGSLTSIVFHKIIMLCGTRFKGKYVQMLQRSEGAVNNARAQTWVDRRWPRWGALSDGDFEVVSTGGA